MQIYITCRSRDNGERVDSANNALPTRSHTIQYACLSVTKNGISACNYGEILGSKLEAELQAVQIALKYAYTQKEDVTVYADFTNIQKRVNGRIKAASQSAKEFAAFVSKARDKINIQIVEELPNRERKILEYMLNNFFSNGDELRGEWQQCKIEWKKPSFRVVVRDREGKVLCDLNENHFGGVIADAIQFANWYECEAQNTTSDYFGVTVERYNVPKREGG